MRPGTFLPRWASSRIAFASTVTECDVVFSMLPFSDRPETAGGCAHCKVPSMPPLPQPASTTSNTIPPRRMPSARYLPRGTRAAHNGAVAEAEFEVTDELVDALE